MSEMTEVPALSVVSPTWSIRFDCWEKDSTAKSSGLGNSSTAEQIL